MPPRHARVLVDTNAIKAAHRTGCWNALRKTFQLETAAQCVEEAIRPNRKGQHLVNRTRDDLSKDLRVHPVTDDQRLQLLYALQGRVDLDPGEKDLLSLALTLKTEAWWLCGPDKATANAMYVLGIIERMCSLQALAKTTGITLAQPAQELTDKWLASVRTQLLLHGRLL